MNICSQNIRSPWEDHLKKSTIIRKQLGNNEMKSRKLRRNKCVLAIKLRRSDVQVAIRILMAASDRKPNPTGLSEKEI